MKGALIKAKCRTETDMEHATVWSREVTCFDCMALSNCGNLLDQ